MTSQIDPTVPVQGTPTTKSVRDNFQIAHDEITALQSMTATQVAISPPIGTLGANVQTGLAALNSGKAGTDSPVLTGNPTAPTAAYNDNDQTISTTAFVQAAVAPALNDIGRNYLHNGLFNVQQRGQVGFTTSGAHTADRWRMWMVLDTLQMSLSAIGDAARTQIGDEAAANQINISVTGNAGATSYSLLEQRIEDVRRLAGKTVTLSFYAIGSSASLKIGTTMQQYMGTGGSPSANVTIAGQAVTLATTWARYSVTFALPLLTGKTLGTNRDDFTSVDFWLSSGANNSATCGGVPVQNGSFSIWGVQLERGNVASPLEKLDFGLQLQQCQRFFEQSATFISTYMVAGQQTVSWIPYVMRKRAAPTVTFSNTSYFNGSAIVNSGGDAGGLGMAWTATAQGQTYMSTTFSASADL